MASQLTDKPVINQEFSAWASGIASKVKEAAKSATAKASESGFGWAAVGVFVIMMIGLFIWYGKARALFETPANISRRGFTALKAQSDYDMGAMSRQGIRAYLQGVKASGIPDVQLCFTNFYICTVNCASIFTPAVDSIVTPAALKTAYDAGARGFVFDLWPDLTPGANFAPVVQIVESGSLWRRISMNALPFASCLQALIQGAYQVGSNPGSEDPLVFYLRFRGKPRASTYTATAQALQATMEQYRLDTIYNNRRGQEDLFKLPITSLFKKVIIASNVKASGNILSDYINIGPRDGIKLEWTPNEPRGLGVNAKSEAVRKIQQNLSFVAPPSETEEATTNYDTNPAFDIGIHCCAMNLWTRNDALKAYMNRFPKASYALKPEPLRYIIEVLPPPKYPEDPGWGSGTTAGTPTPPPGIQLP